MVAGGGVWSDDERDRDEGRAAADIRRLTVYVVGAHQDLLDAWQSVTEWFGGEVPPATLLGVNLLGYRDQLVEVDARIVERAAG